MILTKVFLTISGSHALARGNQKNSLAEPALAFSLEIDFKANGRVVKKSAYGTLNEIINQLLI
ncbi:MAG: hypothetical protein KAI83_02335 [Thiomargarita sp.]|nr:hypothetical protein [Thiomargarita sp.]